MAFTLKRGDTQPVLEVSLLNPDGSAYDPTSAVWVKLHIKLESGTVQTRTMTVVATKPRYAWVAADWTGGTPLVVGTHRMEYEVQPSAGQRLTFPNDRDDTLIITQDLADG